MASSPFDPTLREAIDAHLDESYRRGTERVTVQVALLERVIQQLDEVEEEYERMADQVKAFGAAAL